MQLDMPVGVVALTDAEMVEVNGGALPAGVVLGLKVGAAIGLGLVGVAVVAALAGGIYYAATH
jgi:hypothetical protein